MIFIDRQMLMQVLARNVKRKNQILVGKRVTEVIPSADGVTVKTKDGDSYTGDILVGADGIHSVVRKEMWRLARKAELNYFGPNPQSGQLILPLSLAIINFVCTNIDLKCDYKCLFGISEYDKNVKSFHYYTGQDYSFLLASGPGRRVYWFLFVKLDSTKIGDDIPRYTKEDEAQLVEKHSTDRINESMTFAELYALRTASVMVPIQENVYKRWHFRNIITLGDSAHKVSFRVLTSSDDS
jgi:2-polyprenyl-6-methoxyphenol hydroxylase-like FAD-dependent oxidoreductase